MQRRARHLVRTASPFGGPSRSSYDVLHIKISSVQGSSRAFCTQGAFNYLFWSDARTTPSLSLTTDILQQDASQTPDATLYDEVFVPSGATTNWGTTLSGLLVVPNAISVGNATH